MANFDYSGIRTTGIGLVKKFGRDCTLLRSTAGTVPDPSKPWRVNDGTIQNFDFRGPVTFLGFPRHGDPIGDSSDCDIIVPGDIACGEPLETDRIQVFGTIAGQTDPVFAILPGGVKAVAPDGNGIIYKCRCRAWPGASQSAASGL